MDFWLAERASVRHRISEIRNKIRLLELQDDALGVSRRLIAVKRDTLARTLAYADYIEQRLAAHAGNAAGPARVPET